MLLMWFLVLIPNESFALSENNSSCLSLDQINIYFKLKNKTKQKISCISWVGTLEREEKISMSIKIHPIVGQVLESTINILSIVPVLKEPTNSLIQWFLHFHVHEIHQGYIHAPQFYLVIIRNTLNNMGTSQIYHTERKKSDIKKYILGIFIVRKLTSMNTADNHQIDSWFWSCFMETILDHLSKGDPLCFFSS